MVKEKEKEVKEQNVKYRFFNAKSKFYVYFTAKVGKTYEVLKKKKIQPDSKSVRYKVGNAHILTISEPSFRVGSKSFYVVDILKGQLSFIKGAKAYDPELIDLILEQGTISELAKSSSGQKGTVGWWVALIVGFLGLAIGLIFGGYLP